MANIKISEDRGFWYVDFRTGLGTCAYPKSDFTLDEAIKDQRCLFDVC